MNYWALYTGALSMVVIGFMINSDAYITMGLGLMWMGTATVTKG